MRRLLFLILTLMPLLVFSQSIPIAIPLGVTLNIGLKWQGLASDSTIIDIGGDYYVSTWGDDGGTGAADDPWATWKYAFNNISAGDTVYIKGGNYPYPTTVGIFINNVDGTAINPICIFNYPGETPILDWEGVTWDAGSYYGIYLNASDHWHIKGLEIRNMEERVAYQMPHAWVVDESDSVVYENCVARDNDGNGFVVEGGPDSTIVTYLNCDAINNYDVVGGGGNADGFVSSAYHQASIINYISCRSYLNSDDGFDAYATEGVVNYTDCWSFTNGWQTGTNSEGFKLGVTDSTKLGYAQRVLKNCISANNRLRGYGQNGAEVDIDIFNCFAYNNISHGFYFDEVEGQSVTQTLTNNISYSNGSVGTLDASVVDTYNDWNLGSVTISDGDFEELDTLDLFKLRQADGSQPITDFAHLVEDSYAVDAGTDVGIAYLGNEPDVGYHESPYYGLWILGSGFWNDAGLWVDEALWID